MLCLSPQERVPARLESLSLDTKCSPCKWEEHRWSLLFHSNKEQRLETVETILLIDSFEYWLARGKNGANALSLPKKTVYYMKNTVVSRIYTLISYRKKTLVMCHSCAFDGF